MDRALDEAAKLIVDWAGGTRIGACLEDFNRHWGRRVLRRGAIVVLVSDGCERGSPERLARELTRIRGRCHRLIWLNPYAGNPAYRNRLAGTRTTASLVDEFLPLHDLKAVGDFVAVLRDMPKHPRRTYPAVTESLAATAREGAS